MAKSILAGVDQMFDKHLLPEDAKRHGQAPHFHHGRTLNAIIRAGWREIPVDLFNNTLGQIETNYAEGLSFKASESLWKLRKAKEVQPKQRTPEVTLERHMVSHLGDNWFNQLSTASGLVGSAEGKKRAIDLVERIGAGRFRFFELKVASNTPLAAAIEILEYGLLFAFARKHSGKLFHSKPVPEVLSATALELRVLAPTSYYDKHDSGRRLGWLEAEFSKSFGGFASVFGFKADFQFLSFQQDFRWNAHDAAEDISLGEKLKCAYDAVRPVYS